MRFSRRKSQRLLLVALLVLALGSLAGKPSRPPKVDHKAYQPPPIQLGTSGGSEVAMANGYCCSGTLGALVQDQKGKTQYVLSNTHVFAGDTVPGGNGYVSAKGDAITQPGLVDTRCGYDAYTTVAHLTDWCALVPGGTTTVDAAIAEVVPGTVQADGAILEIGTVSSETVSAFPGQPVKKSGRTTGLSSSTVDSINATVTVGYSDECAGTSFSTSLVGQILIRNRGSKFLKSGDSGSLMVEDVETNPRAVGLLYAGSNKIAVANPITDVLNHFGVEMVGQPAGAAEAVIPSEDSLPRSQLAKAIRLQQMNSRLLLGVPGAMGHAVGVGAGRPVIKILVEEITPEALAAAPPSIEDVPVVVEAVGKIVAF